MGFELWLALGACIGTIASSVIAGIAIHQNKKSDRDHFVYNFSQKLETWYKETLLTLKELFYLPENCPKDQRALLAKLSTEIDIGRGYFKNVRDIDNNANKPELFKGQRVLPIELLVMYHHIFEKGYNKDNYETLRNIERAFISEVTLFTQKIQKDWKIPEYTLIDQHHVLLSDNIVKSEYKDALQNRDIIELVKEVNEAYSETDKKQKSNGKVALKIVNENHLTKTSDNKSFETTSDKVIETPDVKVSEAGRDM